MDFEYSQRTKDLQKRLVAFMDEHIYPNESKYAAHVRSDKRWEPVPIIEELKPKAKAAGLWNLFLPKSNRVAGGGLSNLEYAPLCEIMGRVSWSPEVFNCSAPDTGNMETLERYGTEEQKKQWLEPLLAGEIRSCFAMTEPEVSGADPTALRTRAVPVERSGVSDMASVYRATGPIPPVLRRPGVARPGGRLLLRGRRRQRRRGGRGRSARHHVDRRADRRELDPRATGRELDHVAGRVEELREGRRVRLRPRAADQLAVREDQRLTRAHDVAVGSDASAQSLIGSGRTISPPAAARPLREKCSASG